MKKHFVPSDHKQQALHRVNRMAVIRKLALLDNEREPFFDAITELASDTISVPVSLMSIVTTNEQFFKSSVGLPEPWQTERRTPLSHSFCQHVVITGEPLIVEDAREVDFLKDNLAIPELDVISYLGMPLRADGENPGSFCVIDSKPRQWTSDEVAIMEAFCRVVNSEIDARSVAHREHRLAAYIHTGSRALIHELEANLECATTTGAIVNHLDRVASRIQ